jgi:hypothetical protein
MEKRRLWILEACTASRLGESNAREPGQDDVNGTTVERFDDTRDAPDIFHDRRGRQTPISDHRSQKLLDLYVVITIQ